jgi:hypothetical protein
MFWRSWFVFLGAHELIAGDFREGSRVPDADCAVVTSGIKPVFGLGEFQ